MSSTFDGLYIAKSGVQAARIGLNVTGQNISNAGTAGYTRQRVDLSAISPTALQMLYAHPGAIVGEGVTATGISQLRNTFLDGQYRTQNAKYGLSSTQLSALSDIEDALNETSTDGLSAAFSALIQQLEGLTSTGSSTATESTVKEAASLLATKFNIAASQLETIRNQQYDYLDQYGVDKVNSLLKNIAGLSDQIKNADIAGTPALELMDERNQMIDELSQYVDIKVVETPTDVGAGKTVDTLSICLADSNGDALSGSYPLVDGNQYSKLSVSADGCDEAGNAIAAGSEFVHLRVSGLTKDGINFSVESAPISTGADGKLASDTSSTYTFTLGGTPQTVTIAAHAGEGMSDLVADAQAAVGSQITVGLSSDGKRLTFTPADGSGLSVAYSSGDNLLGVSAAGVPSSDRGLRNADFQDGSLSGYLKLLNENGEFDTPEGGATDTARGIGYYEQMLDTLAKKLAEVMNQANSTNDAGDNKPLFTDSEGHTADITAADIRVSPDWTSNYLTLSKDGANAGDSSSGSNSNITAMITALNSSQYTLSTSKGIDLFTGTLQEGVSNVSVTLGQDIDALSGQDTANSTMLNNIDTRRQALSSVDINEEVVNLIIFNQALSASSRFMTTVDECLDTIINNMGIVGRG